MRIRDCVVLGALVGTLVGFLFGTTNAHAAKTHGSKKHTSHSVTFSKAQLILSDLIVRNHLRSIPFYLTTSPSINAQTDGDKIVISVWFLATLHNNDEVAVVLGHELGHLNPSANIAFYQKDREVVADKLGFIYAQHAGYNSCRGIRLFLRLDEDESADHPADADRYAYLSKRCK